MAIQLDAAEVADRLAIRELFDAYAHCADRRDADGQKIMVASLRYHDRFVKLDGAWYFEERNLIVDWTETWSSVP